MLTSGTAPPAGGQRVVAAVDRAVRGVGRRRRPERRVGDAEADLLVGHVAAALAVPCVMFTPEARSTCEPCCSDGQRDRDADHEDGEHRREDHPGVAPRQHHLPEHEHLRRRDQQDREHLEEVREPVRVLERHGRVRVVEAAAVRAELLDRDLRARPGRARSSARRPRASCAVAWPCERLRHALREQDHREDRAPAAAGCRRASGRGRPRSCRARSPSGARSPRTTATSTAIPTAAETKFCTASPAICVRYDIVYSPP